MAKKQKQGADKGNGNTLSAGQNNALPTAGSGVSSSSSSSTTTQENRMEATLKFRKTDKSGSSSYAIEGLKSSVYFNKGMFAGEPPATLEVKLPEGFKFGEPGQSTGGFVGMTKEQREAALAERKAKLAAMTPAERANLKIEAARKTLEAAEKAAAKLAKTPA
ncbi:MAG: hypothetical protein ACHQX3_00120 [Nitrospirales bacterium]|jgi:hypothetical protein